MVITTITIVMAVISNCRATETMDANQGRLLLRSSSSSSLLESAYQLRRRTVAATATSAEKKRCFENREELKQAVDQYMAVMGVMKHEGQTNGADYDIDAAEYTGDAKHVEDNLRSIYGWPIGTWCTSYVTDFTALFENATTFNDDISGWDTQNVRTMERMFTMATSYNRPLDTWNTHNVKNFNYMFTDASSFHQSLPNWDTSKAITMKAMFADATHFVGFGLNNWNVSQVVDMEAMFLRAKNFDEDISSWSISSNTRLTEMFFDASSFNQNLCSWGDSIVEDFHRVGRTSGGYDESSNEAEVQSTTRNFYYKMFEGANCPITEDPQFSDLKIQQLYEQSEAVALNSGGNRLLSSELGPFCHQCIAPTISNVEDNSVKMSSSPSLSAAETESTIAASFQSKQNMLDEQVYHKPKMDHHETLTGEESPEERNPGSTATATPPTRTSTSPSKSYICRIISFKIIGLFVFSIVLIATIRFVQFQQKHFYTGVDPDEHQLTEFELIRRLHG